MRLHIGRVRRARQRRGMVVIYVTVCFIALMAMLSLATDLALSETAKTELQAAADAAARAGASELLATNNLATETPDTSTATTIIQNLMANSSVDGSYMTSAYFNTNTTDIIWGNWNPKGQTSPTDKRFSPNSRILPINAVEVFARRTTASKNSVTLFFASLLGRTSVDVQAVAIAAVINLAPVGNAPGDISLQSIAGNYDPYLAGAPAWSYKTNVKGTYASAPELATKDSPDANYDTVADGDSGKSDLYQDSSTDPATLKEHPLEFDVSDPGHVGGTVTGTNDTSESPLEVTTNGDGVVLTNPGDVIQVSVPDTYEGQPNLVTNDNGTKPVTTANGFINGAAPNPSDVYQNVGAIPTNDTADMVKYQSGQYDAANPDPQANNTETANSTTATTTNNGASSGDDDVIQGTENNLTNTAAPLNSLMGVFLPPVPPTDPTETQPLAMGNKAPPGYDFTSQTARDYQTLSPQAQQVFYAGSGASSAGAAQSIIVPANAAGVNGGRFFLGTQDGQEWANNSGKYAGVTISFYRVELVR